MLHNIAVINESTVVPDAEAAEIAKALQHQVNHDFRPIWGTNAAFTAIPKGGKPAAGQWWLVILDDMDQAGALGYHDLTNEGLPIAKIGAKTDLEYDAKVSVTCSHEALEMLGDPLINLLAEHPGHGRVYAFENCDAVEADDLGYEVLGQTMSDFVLPAYFQPEAVTAGEALSFRGNVTEPFELAAGGYLSYFTEVGKWKQVTDDGTEHDAAAGAAERYDGLRAEGFPEGSRRLRRVHFSQGIKLRSEVDFDAPRQH
jgi:hypothetical protein